LALPGRSLKCLTRSARFTYFRLLDFRDSFYAQSGLLDHTSTATVSTTGAAGCFTFRAAAFFNAARLGLALAAVRFVALATLRALPRLAEFPLGSFPRFCTFDRFLRLAMIDPLGWCFATH
jgi:hypothetical protein